MEMTNNDFIVNSNATLSPWTLKAACILDRLNFLLVFLGLPEERTNGSTELDGTFKQTWSMKVR